ncbi:universal stress protein [uncultured Croceitalea sp.]|uniref:universal stress protein n=1 Tax=uncultured Croceitalea sp. TaxID=1798908 RepID=UPI00374E5902
MKKILLPTDFSDYALNAIFTTIKLYHKIPCDFILLHTYKPDTRNTIGSKSSTRTGMVYDSLHENVMKKLEDTLDTITKVSDNLRHNFSINAVSGDLATTINELIPKHDLDFIVMGTKGATGAKQIFLGSNTVRVLKKIRNCPILAVPEKFNFQSLNKIIFPTEYAKFFSKEQLKPLVTLTELWRAQVLVFHVAQEFKLSEQQKANKEILKNRLGSIHHSFYKVTIHNTVADAIDKFANEKLADMICLVHYNHTFMEKLTQEPVVKKVGFNTKVPLLILPE